MGQDVYITHKTDNFFAASSECPEPNGRFASSEQCDSYTECTEGVAVEKLCPDGLLFNQRTKTRGECTYAPLSTCRDRLRLQQANGTDDCPRLFGFYSNGDNTKCGEYKNCAFGEATTTKCPEGLAFNVETYQCDWPDMVAECNAEAYLGFTCPASEIDADGYAKKEVDISPEGQLQYFRHPESCKKYFICVNGHPRLYNCGRYLAFNAETKLCDFYNKIPECYARIVEARKNKLANA